MATESVVRSNCTRAVFVVMAAMLVVGCTAGAAMDAETMRPEAAETMRRTDAFWREVAVVGEEAEVYDSLESMT